MRGNSDIVQVKRGVDEYEEEEKEWRNRKEVQLSCTVAAESLPCPGFPIARWDQLSILRLHFLLIWLIRSACWISCQEVMVMFTITTSWSSIARIIHRFISCNWFVQRVSSCQNTKREMWLVLVAMLTPETHPSRGLAAAIITYNLYWETVASSSKFCMSLNQD